jgi:hypothetical protein
LHGGLHTDVGMHFCVSAEETTIFPQIRIHPFILVTWSKNLLVFAVGLLCAVVLVFAPLKQQLTSALMAVMI